MTLPGILIKVNAGGQIMMKNLGFAGVFAAGFLAACSGGADDTRTLHRGSDGEPLTLDPQKTVLNIEFAIIMDMFTGLYVANENGDTIPGLVAGAETSDDGLVWRFTLRESRWSDGIPVTAHDVAAGIQRAANPATLNENSSKFFIFENGADVIAGNLPPEALGVEALDDLTLEIRLAYPMPYLEGFLVNNSYPLPRHVHDIHGDAWIQPENIVTNGPYVLSQWRTSNFIELTANPEFFEAGQICFDTVYYYPVSDRVTGERMVRTGALDLHTVIEGSNINMLRDQHGGLLRESASYTAEDILFNTAAGPFTDVRVRQAFSMAIDRRFIANEILNGASGPSFRMISEAVPNAAPGLRLSYADDDMETRREQARALLIDAGYGPENPLDVVYQHTPYQQRIAPVLQQDWALIAPWVSVDISVGDVQFHFAAMRAGDFTFGNNGWTPEYGDPYASLLIWESRAGEINYSRWTHADYDALIEAGLSTSDVAERQRLFGAAEEILLAEVPHAPLLVPINFDLVRPDITGWNANPALQNRSRWLCREGLEPISQAAE